MSNPPIPWTCPKCKAENPPDFTHCRLCGIVNPELPEQEKTCSQCGHHFYGTCCPVCGSQEFLQL